MEMILNVVMIQNVLKGKRASFKKLIYFLPVLVQKVFVQIHCFSFLDVLIFFPYAFVLILTLSARLSSTKMIFI